MVNVNELKEAIQSSNINIPEAEITKIIDEVDYFGNGKINYSEFLVATIDVMSFLDDTMLQAIFNQFDTDSSGVITKENIIAAMSKIGHQITQDELDEIMSEHDTLKNDVITYTEFKNIFMDIKDMEHDKTK